MSHNDLPPRIIVDPSLYEIVAKRRADRNAARAADGLPPTDDDFPFITQEQADAADAQEKARRARQKPASNLAPPPPTRGPLCRAAKAKLAERNASISGFERHSRKCRICRSPYVDAIEQIYLQWERVDRICEYFQLGDGDTVYRHARAAGLDVLRRQNSRWVVEQFIEQWRSVKISSATVIRSIRALSCLDDKGRWTDLPKTHIVVRGPGAASRESDTGLLEPGPTGSSAPSPERSSGPQNDVPFSFERSEPHRGSDSGLPASGSSPTAVTVSSLPSKRTSRPLDDALSSYERSEPHRENASGLASPGAPSSTEFPQARPAVVSSSSSNERSEPHQNGSGLPGAVVTSVTDFPETGPIGSASSTEQREPDDENSSAHCLSGTGALHRHKEKNVPCSALSPSSEQREPVGEKSAADLPFHWPLITHRG